MLEIKVYDKGPLGENTYLVTDRVSKEQIIIDPGYYGEDVVADIIDDNSLKYVILTHAHFDHFCKASYYLDKYPKSIFVAPFNDQYLMGQGANTEFSKMGLIHPECPKADRYVTEKDNLQFASTEVSFIDTPGHTEGSMCVLVENALFSGDTLFRLSVGNTSFETGDFSQLVKSIQNKLFTLNDDIVVYPGHGITTTIGYEKRGNPFV